MEIGRLPALSTQISLQTSKESIKDWQVGQLLKARVGVDDLSQQRFIDIGGARIKADRQLPFAPGQLLSLRVEQTGSKPELRILTAPSYAAAQPTSLTAPSNATTPLIYQAIRAVIGQQAPMTVLLPVLMQAINAIDKLALSSDTIPSNNSTVSGASKLAPNLELELKTAAQRIRDFIPSLSQLRQPQQVKQSSLNSGIFFESKLARANPSLNPIAIAKDIKPILLQLVATVRQAIVKNSKLSPQFVTRLEEKIAQIETKSTTLTGKAAETQTRAEITRLLQLQPLRQLLKTSESLLSRIQLGQLSSLVQSSETNPIWYMEIPYAHQTRHHTLQLRIGKENSHHRDNNEEGWQLEFSFELGDHGKILSDVRLKRKVIHIRFTAETTAGLQLLQDNLHLLNTRLRSLGFEVNIRPSQQGEVEDLLLSNTLESLLDTHA